MPGALVAQLLPPAAVERLTQSLASAQRTRPIRRDELQARGGSIELVPEPWWRRLLSPLVVSRLAGAAR